MRTVGRTGGGWICASALALAALGVLLWVALAGHANAQESSDVTLSVGAPEFNNDASSRAAKVPKPIRKPKNLGGITVRSGHIPHPPPRPSDLVEVAAVDTAIDTVEIEPAASAEAAPDATIVGEVPAPEPTAATDSSEKPPPPAPPKPRDVASPEVAPNTEAVAATEEPPATEAGQSLPKPGPERPRTGETPTIEATPLEAVPVEPPPETPDLPKTAAEATEETTVASLPEEPVSVASDALRIPFGVEGADLPESALQPLQELAARLSREPNLRVQLFAFAAGTEKNASQARRLSLSRALAVRAVLIDSGVRSTRMDVRALGSNTNEAPLDRVDILVVRRGGG